MKTKLEDIHPQLRKAVGRNLPFSVTSKTIWIPRGLMRLMPPPGVGDGVVVENRSLPGQDPSGEIRLRIYRPATTLGPTPVLLWLHGGGYVMGKPEINDADCDRYVRELGVSVVSVGYRLSPEHPFPAGLNDAYAALRWLGANGSELGFDSARVAVGGASAGAGLAAALAQLAHDRGECDLAFQLLIYPMLDDRTAIRPGAERAERPGWSGASNRFGWKSYLGASFGLQEIPSYAAPARRPELSGLPPAWIGVGSIDLFHDEDVAYADRLQVCGVDCELVIVPGAFHGFDVLAPEAPVVEAFRRSQMAALKRYLL